MDTQKILLVNISKGSLGNDASYILGSLLLNKACKALFDRIVAKVKSKKLALIAVCNKLLKQAFAIVKNGVPYDNEYRSKLAINN